ncbi:uncharacterized protein LOC108471482 [Gossypium arboreum]|uniref:uncharacterized protein LOC108471482 n=1 Tax=Gossypium arboreum TaxID=29729 RepID=UPI0008195367|nr:uncharacterized protein LOC108471482 [Gossypium arboreum]
MGARLVLPDVGSILEELRARLIFLQQIFDGQKADKELQAKRVQCESSSKPDFQNDFDGCLRFRGRIYVSDNAELIQNILHEAHSGCLSVHPGLLPPIIVPDWKWDRITINSITGLPLTSKKKDIV